jgi:hypothetical protein
MSGISTSPSRIDPLHAKAATIQLRLPVLIVPLDSNVESSNMTRLPQEKSAAPTGRRKP